LESIKWGRRVVWFRARACEPGSGRAAKEDKEDRWERKSRLNRMLKKSFSDVVLVPPRRGRHEQLAREARATHMCNKSRAV